MGKTPDKETILDSLRAGEILFGVNRVGLEATRAEVEASLKTRLGKPKPGGQTDAGQQFATFGIASGVMGFAKARRHARLLFRGERLFQVEFSDPTWKSPGRDWDSYDENIEIANYKKTRATLVKLLGRPQEDSRKAGMLYAIWVFPRLRLTLSLGSHFPDLAMYLTSTAPESTVDRQESPASAKPVQRWTCTTDAGMWGVWDPCHFAQVQGYDEWETELLELKDIRRHIKAGHFVPINLGSDGTFDIELRTALTSKQKKYLLVKSDAYLLKSQGTICFGGIEHVSAQPTKTTGRLPVTAGEYSVVVHLMDREASPESDPLPDLVVTLTPKTRGFVGATKLQTFPPPP